MQTKEIKLLKEQYINGTEHNANAVITTKAAHADRLIENKLATEAEVPNLKPEPTQQ